MLKEKIDKLSTLPYVVVSGIFELHFNVGENQTCFQSCLGDDFYFRHSNVLLRFKKYSSK